MVSLCMSGTRGSCVLSSTGDMLEMSVARGVGRVCDMCICLAQGGVGGEGVSEPEDWVWAIPILWGQGGVRRVSVLRWCGWCRWAVGRGLGPGSRAVEWCYVCVRCESGFSV